jgi:hypothetical protein
MTTLDSLKPPSAIVTNHGRIRISKSWVKR